MRRQCARYFDVHSAPDGLRLADGAITELGPALLVFDFDHPQPSQLRMMQSIKRRHPSLPLLMITLGHSESLAVWAFRSKVWNYLVKPVLLHEFEDNLLTLVQIAAVRRERDTQVLTSQPQVPNSPSAVAADPGTSLRPAIERLAAQLHVRISAERLARECGLSRYEFSRRFRRAYGLTFREYVLRLRVSEACRRLRAASGDSITDIGFSVGFNDGSYFARIFRRFTGMLPSEYVERSQSGLPLPEIEVTVGQPHPAIHDNAAA